jgi:3-hydroxyisobutyrate dehydrogenase
MQRIQIMDIAFLGLGAMGSRMAANLVKAGHALTVWNRDPKKAEALVAVGASLAETPRAAAQHANIVISMVRDDEASQKIWCDPETGAFAGMKKGALAIECSTLSVAQIKSLATEAAGYGFRFIDAPLAGSRPQAEAAQLIFFASGKVQDVAEAEPILNSMGSAVHRSGDVGSGATVKLMVNALFGIQLAAMGELIGLAKKSGIDAAKAVEIMGNTPVVSPAAKLAAGAMLAGNFAPVFPIELVAKDFGYVVSTAAAANAATPISAATLAAFESAIAQGHGGKNITGIAAMYG